jgi:hypothetical protein
MAAQTDAFVVLSAKLTTVVRNICVEFKTAAEATPVSPAPRLTSVMLAATS